MLHYLPSLYAKAGLPIIGDFILIEREDRPYEDTDEGTFMHTYTAARHVPEPLDEDSENIYLLDFVLDNYKGRGLPNLDKRFWAFCRIQGAQISEKNIRTGLLVIAWADNLNEIVAHRNKEAAKAMDIVLASWLDVHVQEGKPASKEEDNAGRKTHSLPTSTSLKKHRDTKEIDKEDADPEDHYPDSSPDDPEPPNTPKDDDIPFEDNNQDDEPEDLDDNSWADNLEGEEDERQ